MKRLLTAFVAAATLLGTSSVLAAVDHTLYVATAPAGVPGAATYNGYLYSGGDITGTLQVNVTSGGAVTATINVAGEKRASTVTGNVNMSTGALSAGNLSLTLNQTGMTGTYGSHKVDGAILSSDAESVQAGLTGTVSAAWSGENGYGYASVTIAAKAVSITGKSDTGASFTAKPKFIVGQTWCCIPVAIAKKKSTISFALWIQRSSGYIDISPDGAVGSGAEGLASDVAFSSDSTFGDKVFDYVPDDVPVSQSGKKWVVLKGGKVKMDKKEGEVNEDLLGDNPCKLKLTYNWRKYTFSGSFKAYYETENKGKLKSKKAKVSGIVINGRGYGRATISKYGSAPVVIE